MIVSTAYASSKQLSESEMNKIANATINHSYSAIGTTSIQWQGKWYRSVIHQYNKKPDKSRIEYNSYPLSGVVVCGDGKMMWREDPQIGKQVSTESAGCMSSGQKIKLFFNNYEAYKTGTTRQAGRNALIIDIKDRSGKLKKRLWVDTKTYVTLRSEDYDASSKIISTTAFKSIDYKTKISDSIFKRSSGKLKKNCENLYTNIKTVTELSKKLGSKVLLPKYMPKGFHVDGFRLYKCSCNCAYKAAYIRYSNGITGISIFESIDVFDCSRVCGEGMHMPAEKANISIDGLNIYIITDLKSSEIKRIAGSFK
ncbi:MAG: LolA family protein [Armatimonadota bacterium]